MKNTLPKNGEGCDPKVIQLEQIGAELSHAKLLQKALYQIAKLAKQAKDMASFYRALHEIVSPLMHAENFYIALLDETGEWVHFPYFVDEVELSCPTKLPLSELRDSHTGKVLATGEPLHQSSPDFEGMACSRSMVQFGGACTDWLGVPLIGEKSVSGIVAVQSYGSIQFEPRDQKLLCFVGRHISLALGLKQFRQQWEFELEARTRELREVNRELQQEIKERNRAEQLQRALFHIAEVSNSALSMDDFFRKIHGIVGYLIDAGNFHIAVYQDDGKSLTFPYYVDRFEQGLQPGQSRFLMLEMVLQQGEAMRMALGPEVDEAGDDVGEGSNHYWMGVPLKIGSEVLGALAVSSSKANHTYQARDQELLTFVSQHIAAAIGRRQSSESLRKAHGELEERVRSRTMALYQANRVLEQEIAERSRMERLLMHEALHDALTGLPNRNLFMDRLNQAFRRLGRGGSQRFAVLFLDLDRFKVINDSLGHMFGDHLLKEVSRRIAICIRLGDTVARLGGDEFAVLLDGISGIEEAKAVANRICVNLDRPFELEGTQVFSSVSIGIALSHPRYQKPENMLRDADAAMYRAKAMGRRRFEIFDESMHLNAVWVLNLESDLRRALEKNEFRVAYQPIISLEDGQIVAFEALVRWYHTEKGLIMPCDFIQLAEETGIITHLDWCVFRQACQQFRRWMDRYPCYENLKISINLSSKHFSNRPIVEKITQLLTETDVPPERLKLEITESVLLGNLPSVKSVLEILKDMGVEILLDDFGTGYSSLNYLHRFPVDSLKIDRSFVSNMDKHQESCVIVRSIGGLAEGLKIQVIAEGIETEKQFHQLRDWGCEFGQGYWISPPLDVEGATVFLQKGWSSKGVLAWFRVDQIKQLT